MQVTLVQCSPRLIEEEIRKSQEFLSCMNGSKRVARTWKMIKEMVDQDLTESTKNRKSVEYGAFT
jgi:hypothetical protein